MYPILLAMFIFRPTFTKNNNFTGYHRDETAISQDREHVVVGIDRRSRDTAFKGRQLGVRLLFQASVYGPRQSHALMAYFNVQPSAKQIEALFLLLVPRKMLLWKLLCDSAIQAKPDLQKGALLQT